MEIKKKADRAKQFLPFDALKGFKEAIKAKEKIIADKKQLSEDDAKILDYKLNKLSVGMMVKITYYLDNEYIKIEGLISKIDLDLQTIVVVKTKINIKNIINIESDEIEIDY